MKIYSTHIRGSSRGSASALESVWTESSEIGLTEEASIIVFHNCIGSYKNCVKSILLTC